jgi:predicted amidohydrolase
MVPELYLTGYNVGGIADAEPAGGPSFLVVQRLSRQYNISILFTYPERDANSSAIYDSSVLFYRDGSVLAEYRKVNLASGESEFLTPGASFAPVVEVDGVLVGLLICFDIFLPEPARILALSRVQLLLVPTANGYPKGINVVANLIVPTRGLENNAFIAYVNWVQDNAVFPPYLQFHGQTTVADAGGNVLFQASDTVETFATIVLDVGSMSNGSTVFGRPEADLRYLCDNVSSPRTRR